MSKEEEKIWVDFDPNDFVIRIAPVLDNDDSWTGELRVGYMTLDENFLKDDDYQHLDMVANLAMSSIQLMEDDHEFRDKLYNYTLSVLKGSGKPIVEKDDSNIIKLRFN